MKKAICLATVLLFFCRLDAGLGTGCETGAPADLSIAWQGSCLHIPRGEVYRFRRP